MAKKATKSNEHGKSNRRFWWPICRMIWRLCWCLVVGDKNLTGAFLVQYEGPAGTRAESVVILEDTEGGSGRDMEAEARKILADARCGCWKEHDVRISGMIYLGPWFR
ncbi:hypothetical protein ES703_93942 [subsurface metagenome]